MNREYDRMILDGLNIIDSYIPASKDFNFMVGRDQLWFGRFEVVDDEKDIEKLKKLGWFEDEEAWSIFV